MTKSNKGEVMSETFYGDDNPYAKQNRKVRDKKPKEKEKKGPSLYDRLFDREKKYDIGTLPKKLKDGGVVKKKPCHFAKIAVMVKKKK